MEATAPRVPWWYFALFAVVMTAFVGTLMALGFGWPVQIGSCMLLLLGLLAVIRRGRA